MNNPDLDPALEPLPSTTDRLLVCDLCGTSEVRDLIEGRGTDLIPMYRAVSDGAVVCRPCALADLHLEIAP